MSERWLSSLQPNVRQNCKRTRKYPRLLIKWNQYLEDAKYVENLNFNRSHLQSFILSYEPWWHSDCDWCRGWDFEVLERFSEKREVGQRQINT